MAPSPFRRKSAGKTLRNLALAEAALALAKDKARAATPGRKSRRPSGKLLLLGGAVAAAGAAALLKRDKVAGLLPSRSGEPDAPETPAPPQQSNYDAPGPVANTATPVPAPDPQQPAAIDESAEEAAAAAEAGAIGGRPSDYAGSEPGKSADEAQRPLAEAGEGESEGQEQAEAGLAANAEFRDSAPTDAERQIEDTIEAADQPSAGETPEPLVSDSGASGTDADDASDSGTESAQDAEAAEQAGSNEEPGQWRTWSGRSVEP
jgi:hypothetical protein